MSPRATHRKRRFGVATITLLLLAACTPGHADSQSPATPRPAPSDSSGSPTASASPTPSLAPNKFRDRVPTFPAAPPAQPVTLHGGPEAPFFSRLPTTAPVAFLTMDDGYSRSPDALELMRAAGIPFTLFLIAPVAAQDPAFFKQLTQSGAVIADHTLTHPTLKGRSYASQKHEICGAADSLANTFGARPKLFRPPFGAYDHTTLRAAHDCAMTAVLNWSETVDKGIVRYQTAEHRIKAGDIILMHFRPAFIDDVLAALNAIKAAGLTPAVLTDYLVPPAA